MPDHADAFAAEAREAPLDRSVLRELAVACQRREVGEQPLDVVGKVRPLRMTRDLRLLPGRQARIDVLERQIGLSLQPADFVAYRDAFAGGGECAQLLDLGV